MGSSINQLLPYLLIFSLQLLKTVAPEVGKLWTLRLILLHGCHQGTRSLFGGSSTMFLTGEIVRSVEGEPPAVGLSSHAWSQYVFNETSDV